MQWRENITQAIYFGLGYGIAVWLVATYITRSIPEWLGVF